MHSMFRHSVRWLVSMRILWMFEVTILLLLTPASPQKKGTRGVFFRHNIHTGGSVCLVISMLIFVIRRV